MSIKRYIANADNTITDAYENSLLRRAYYANMGGADALEYYSIFGQESSGSVEKSRILVKFPVEEISSSRTQGLIPESGNVNFYISLSNVKHPFSLPSNYDVLIAPLSSSWEEGTGLDMDNYLDIGISGSSGVGSNWKFRQLDQPWVSGGGDFLYEYSKVFHIDKGEEDLFVDVTDVVERQISGEINNYGFGIMLSGNYESAASSASYYTKKFSARNSQYFYKRPYIEARWDDSIKDDRSDFYSYSNLLSDNDNKYNLYFYNKIKGIYRNIPNNPTLTVKFFADEAGTQEVIPEYLEVSNPSIGKFKAVVSIDTTASYLYDQWMDSLNTSSVYFKGSFNINQLSAYETDHEDTYIFKINNLKNTYSNSEVARLNVFSRKKNWTPNIYNISSTDIDSSVHKNLYYKVFRYMDNYNIIDYSTGSLKYSLMSYDSSVNYFNLDMSLFQPDFAYGIKFAFLENNQIREVEQVFKFRVE